MSATWLESLSAQFTAYEHEQQRWRRAWPVLETLLKALLRAPDMTATLVFLDDCEERGLNTMAARALLGPANIRQVFRTINTERNTYSRWRGVTECSVLAEARAWCISQALRQLFPWFNWLNARDAVNEFTRSRMREDGFFRKLLPLSPV
jgi:hypothetical protein